MKVVWHKHNLIISSSVGSSHPDKYSFEISHGYFQGQGNSRNFVGTATFLVELAQNKDIYRRVTFSKQVLLLSNNIFRTDTFLNKGTS